MLKRYRPIMISVALVVSLLAMLALDRRIFSPPIAHAEYAKLVSITGGSPAQRLSDALTTSGYTGSALLDELTICVPDSNSNTAYIGSSSAANASTGFPLAPGTCITYRAAARAIDASRTFVWETSTESIAITIRER